MINAKKKITAGCLSVLMCLAPVWSVCAADTGQPAGAGDETENVFVGNGNSLWKPLKITGSLMPEEQIFRGKDIITIQEEECLGLDKYRNYAPDGSYMQVKGVDIAAFLEMCGVSQDAPDDAVVQIFTSDSVNPEKTVLLSKLKQTGQEGLLNVGGDAFELYLRGEDGGKDIRLNGVTKILVSTPDDLSDPHYGFHSDGPLSYMQDMTFTVNFIDRGEEDEAEPFRTVTYTMGEIEEMMAEHPEQVFGNYFGISGNEETKNTLGLGGFSDYYEGISLSWFLTEKAGLKEGEGSALFYGRDDDLYGEVKDLGYFFPENGDYSGYYLELSDICSVSGVVPVIAVSKNGYPLLPEHNHDLEGNVDYNVFNGNALAKGFETEIGLVKNVSGPFVAGLANLDGVYGGYRNETAGDCIRIDLYVDRGLYDGESAGKYIDVPSDAWYAEYVNELSERGIVNGRTEGKFEPEAPVTRAEFVKLAAGIAGADVSRYSVSAFDDVSANAWYAPYVAWAAETGIVTGCSDAEFCPDREISRQDMAVILCRLAEKSGDVLKSDNPPLTFADAAEIAPYAEDAVAAMQKAGVISGRGGQKFAPRENATRAEACKMLVTLAEQIF